MLPRTLTRPRKSLPNSSLPVHLRASLHKNISWL
jgi:hypothetical protein